MRTAIICLVLAVAVCVVRAGTVSVQSDAIQAAIDADPVLAEQLNAAIANARLSDQRLNGEEPFDAKVATTVASLNRASPGAGDAFAARVAAYRAQIVDVLGDVSDDTD
jgi:hypothetical protein